MEYSYITTIGQDSHAFDLSKTTDGIMLGGVKIPFDHPYIANSDGDVLLHAVTNAISGFTTRNILGGIADKMCLTDKITDSREYLKVGLEDLKKMEGVSIVHLSVTIECKRPKLMPHMEEIRLSLSSLLNIPASHIGITATTGEGLTSFGRGEGMQVFALLTLRSPLPDA
ncbi:MAG: 2-C-methyl-D-erythritol 2,4-cyclodiphosphate synthase [Clostridiales bacterium]|nr:2-C-methyl-D-erythritol 2,4-cyclodiphosphate synthase [Clostridiales bacterium]